MKKCLVGFIMVVVVVFVTGAASASTVWNSNFITFTKADYAPWDNPSNQDRITSDVWLTRGDNAGMFNAAVESWDPGYSGWNGEPTGTEWAWGTTADYNTLTYMEWLYLPDTYPLLYVNNPAVLHLINDDIYIDLEFTQWTVGSRVYDPDTGELLAEVAGGGFSYTRASATSVPEPATMLLLGLGLIGLAGMRRKFSN